MVASQQQALNVGANGANDERDLVQMLNEKLGVFAHRHLPGNSHPEPAQHAVAEERATGALDCREQESRAYHDPQSRTNEASTTVTIPDSAPVADGKQVKQQSTPVQPSIKSITQRKISISPTTSRSTLHALPTSEPAQNLTRRRKRLFTVGIILLLLIGIGIGVGVGLSKHNQGGSDSPNPSSPSNPPAPTTTTALHTLTLPNNLFIRDIAIRDSKLYVSYNNSVQEFDINTWSSLLHTPESGAVEGQTDGNVFVGTSGVWSSCSDGSFRSWVMGANNTPTVVMSLSTTPESRIPITDLGRYAPIWANGSGIFGLYSDGVVYAIGGRPSGSRVFDLVTLGDGRSLYGVGGLSGSGVGYIEHWEVTGLGVGNLTDQSRLVGNVTFNTTTFPTKHKGFAIHPTATSAFLYSGNGNATQIDLTTGRVLNTFSGPLNGTAWTDKSSAMSLAISPDGKYLFTGHDVSVGSPVIQWDVESGKEVRGFLGHQNTVGSVVVSADGKVLYSGSDHTVRQWGIE
ncbi:hypothetical protein HDV00_010040 [Rhizophlyctis rosea]|nr:hypothetical protein HDV00_010040 [Rhizophlyctis rosea]